MERRVGTEIHQNLGNFLKVLDIIIQDQGVNELVESNRVLKSIPEEEVGNDSSGDESKEDQ